MFCGSCGNPLAEGVRFCANCGNPLVQAAPVQPAPPVPYQAAAPPPAWVPPPPPAVPIQNVASPATFVGGFALAGMGERVVASVLDMIFIGILFAVAGMATAAQLGGVTDSGFSLNGMPAAVTIGITSIAGFLYFWLAEGLFGSTLGKAIAGIQVRRKTGAPPGMSASLLRNILRIIDGIGVYLVGFCVAILSKTRQRIGDHVAGTVVVESPISKPLRVFVALVWFAALVGGLAGAYVIHRGAPESVTGEFAALPATIPVTSTGRLKAGNFVYTEGKGGPVRANAIFKPGDLVFLKYDIAGFARDAQKVPDLGFLLTAADPAGVAIHEPCTVRFNSALDRGQPVNGYLGMQLPPYAPPGRYKISIKIHDAVDGANLELTPSIEVNAAAVAPPHGLELRDFQLSRTETGPGESVPAMEGGSTVYMNANIFGLQFRDGKTSGRMSLTVLDPDGKVALDQPNFIDLSDAEFYRPPTYWIHVSGRIPIPAGLKAGIYTEQYAVIDNVSNQTVTQDAKFEVK
jgi:uncharacterized RDD family membrane protein YckC